jgi:hypothetical protein
MVESARRSGKRVPIIFAPAEGTRYLVAWALLDDVVIEDKTTAYTFSELRFFKNRHLKTSLSKASNGEPLAEMFIRPLAFCRTPEYLDQEKGEEIKVRRPPEAKRPKGR